MSQPTRETRILALAALLLALLVTSPGRLSAAAASLDFRSEEQASNLESVSFASGMVLAVSEEQIGLLQYHEASTSYEVAIFSYGDTTVLPADASLAPGEDVVIEFLTLTDDQLLAIRVQRLPAVETTATLLVSSGSSIAEDLNKNKFATCSDGPREALQRNAKNAPAAKPTLEDLQIEGCCPAEPEVMEAEDCTDRFTFGKVISVMPQGLVVREYDFARDADVEVFYQLLPETEYVTLSDERLLQIGDDVVVDYQEQDGQRLVTRLVREDSGEVE